MMSEAPTPAPIHDITGPWDLAQVPLPAVVAGAAALLLLALLGVWLFYGRRRAVRLTPREKALQALGTLRGMEATPYEFGVRTSDILRTYVRDAFGLDAVTRTSIEFLESIRDNHVFDANEKASLAAFLEASDLLKYARVEAGSDEIGRLLETATRLVETRKEEAA
jgi:hypothetical protein